MNKYIVLILIICPLITYSQKKIESTYYDMVIPDNIEIKSFKAVNEEKANIESFQLLINSSPICILFLMSNKLEVSVVINEENYKEFIYDIGDLVISKVIKKGSCLKIYYMYKNKEIKGILYLESKKDILSRFIFMFPNDKFLVEYDDKVELMFNSVQYKKQNW